MRIFPATPVDIDVLATIVRDSNKDVAEQLNLNIHNAPKHPSFCTPEWIRDDMQRGQCYYLYRDTGLTKGCVALEHADSNTIYLNRLAVLPDYRRRGIGATLTGFIIEKAREKGAHIISIGTIAEHRKLTTWYEKQGFTKGSTHKFDHLPFTVLYMSYEI